jgi:Flp pilus assembly protein TadD
MRSVAGVLTVALLASIAFSDEDREQTLWHYRNLGKAFYENPTTQLQAVEEFQKALQLNPDSAREQLNYGLALLRAGQTPKAVEQLLKVQKEHPELPHTWFNLGIVYKKDGNFAKSLPQFQKFVALVPHEPVGHYNLGVLYKQEDRMEDAIREFNTAIRLNHNLAAPHFQLYNAYRTLGRREDAAKELQEFQRLKKAQEGAAIPEDMEWCDYAEIYDPVDMRTPPSPRAATYEYRKFPYQADGSLILDADGDGRPDLLIWHSAGLTLLRGGATPVDNSGLDGIRDVVAAAPGDFDNDGRMDLCVVTAAGPTLYHNAGGRFERRDAALPQRRFEQALWVDYDHDYDLDLFLLGEKSALYRNQGTAGFVERTADFPFIDAHAVDGVLTRHLPDSKAFDIAVSYAARQGVLYRDQLGGLYTREDFTLAPGARRLGVPVSYDGQLRVVPDYAATADFNGDGQLDVVTHDAVGINTTKEKSNWIVVDLAGIKNLKLAQGAEVEIKTGAFYQKQIYDGYPLTFDLRDYTQADTVRITWPNGLIQNEMKQAANQRHTYKEAQRLSGSCPMIWTWNGREYQFITDVLGVAPLGAKSGDGSYFPVDHDEYVQIPAEAMAARNGQYELHITEELAEVSYLDQVRLFAVDHPADQDVYIGERWKSPPYPELKFYGASKKLYPIAAKDDHGHDVLARVRAKDRAYPDDFSRNELGTADLHWLTLDFPRQAKSSKAVLVLNGWVDWADGSTFLAAAQQSKAGLIPPYLQARDASGRWVTIDADMGMPDGKPKTIAVEVQFPSGARQLRIVTNLCVYWDEIFLIDSQAPPPLRRTAMRLSSAELRFRGFSATRIHPERKQPDEFIYASVSPSSHWNPTPGNYTRYGEVGELLETVDDRFVIMGSGDELQLRYDARALPPLLPGWTRDFLLKVDGWAKDRDANTAYSQSVMPLPFHGMSRYPYPPTEQYPKDIIHSEYQERYNTRPALVLIRPLVARHLGSQ